MHARLARAFAATLLGASGLAGLAGLTACRPASTPHAYLPEGDAEHPRIRFQEGTVSPNDRCPVTKKKLNPAMEPIYVNGLPVAFC